jgi:antitoxin VapB
VNELERQERRIPLAERLRPLLERVDAVPDTGLPADKAFFDDLNGQP